MIKNREILMILIRSAIADMETIQAMTNDVDIGIMAIASQAQLQAIRKKLEDDGE